MSCRIGRCTPRSPIRVAPGAWASNRSDDSTSFAVGGVLPDVVVLLDVSAACGVVAAERYPRQARGGGQAIPRHGPGDVSTTRRTRNRTGFLIVAADGGFAQVEAAIWAAIEPLVEADAQ